MSGFLRDEDRNRTLRRVLRLALRLRGCSQRPSIRVLAEELRVSERTIRRDIAALVDVDWPVPAPFSEAGMYSRRSASGVGSQGCRHPWKIGA